MSLTQKVQEMVGMTPSYSNVEREHIRSDARKKVTSSWFGVVLDHHEKIEAAFDAVKDAKSLSARTAAQKELALILTGHSIAEEAIIYPFMKLETSSMHATHAYAEQALAKTQMVALDAIADKMSKDYEAKLEEIRGAVVHHMIEEERDFFPELQEKAAPAQNKKITQHYQMEFDRYCQNPSK